MNKIKIFSDSTCDLTPEIIKKYDIGIIPLYVNFKDASYKDGIDINTESLYKRVKENGSTPKTAAPSPDIYYEYFKKYADKNHDIIYIGLSSFLSSSCQNASIAAKMITNVKVQIINSFNLSSGIGLEVIKAAELRDSGMKFEDIVKSIECMAPKIKTAFVIDTLEYLYKGGRCSAIQNLLGTVLMIKPIIEVSEGKMRVADKIRGKRKRALDKMLSNVLKNKDKVDTERIMITHSMGYDDAVYLKEILSKNINFNEIIITDAGCVISSHCGPNTVGILYVEK